MRSKQLKESLPITTMWGHSHRGMTTGDERSRGRLIWLEKERLEDREEDGSVIQHLGPKQAPEMIIVKGRGGNIFIRWALRNCKTETVTWDCCNR